MMENKTNDKAGQDYWNQTWDSYLLPNVWDVESKALKNYVEREFFHWIAKALESLGKTGSGLRLVEVGCARSQALPVLGKRLGLSVAGIDYSANGCEQTRIMMKREGVNGEVYCSDIFAVPDSLKGSFDIVVSFGLIEHFSDTNEIVSALAELLKPGGVIITNIPNMCGTTGFVQKILNRQIYDIHVPLTPPQVRAAHEAAGLKVIECDYFLSSNYGVVNLGHAARKNLGWWMKKIVLAILVRMSMVIWLIERAFGKLPKSQYFSPYVNCIAVRQHNP
ncbi:MAG: class I SAM-dependent methyltransferase [Pseudomonadota bacterium]